jgi:hypothetical protein
MKKRNRITNVLGLGSLPTSQPTVKEPNYETPRQLSNRLRREDAEELAKKQQAIEDADPLRQAEKANVEAMTQLALATRDRLKKLYRDVPTIEDYIRHDIEALIDDIGLPSQNPPVTMNEFETRIKTFVEGLPKSVKFNSDTAKRKFELYAWVAARQGTVIDNSTLQAMLERSESLGIGVTLPRATKKQPVPPEPTPTWSVVQDLNPENREQKKQIVRALGEDFTSEVAAFFGLWRDQLRRDYSYEMPEAIIKRALQYVTDNNLQPLRHETWNIVRRVFTRNGWMLKADGSMILTEREKLSDLCDRSDLNDREVRRQINLKNRELLDSEPAYAPHK